MHKLLALFSFSLLLFACKKPTSGSAEPFYFYFSDTSASKPTGAVLTSSELMDSISVINEADSSDFPFFSKLAFPDQFEIITPKPGKQNYESCVGWSLGYGLLSQHQLVLNYQTNFNYYNSIFSPTFIYNYVNGGVNNGLASLGIGLSVLKNKGSCKWNTMKGSVSFNVFPDNNAISEAANYKISGFSRLLYKESRLKFYLSRNYLIPFGAYVDEGFMTGKFKESFRKTGDGRLVWEKSVGSGRAGHAMLICGYDDQIKAFKVLNSWGEEWGNGGFIWIDYDLMPQILMGSSTLKPELFIAYTKRSDISAGLIAYYKYNGNVLDDSGNGNNGIISGGITYTEDRNSLPNRSAWFNGTDGYIIVPPSSTINSITKQSDATFACWFKTDSWNNVGGHISKNNNGNDLHYRFLINETGSLLQVEQPYANGNYPALAVNRWYHFAAVKSGNTARFYLDGTLINETTMINDIWVSDFNTNLEIGRDAHGPVEHTRGAFDDIRIYNRALNQSEIQIIKNL